MHPTARALQIALADCRARKLVFLTSPSEQSSQDSVFLWPWRAQEDSLLRNAPSRAGRAGLTVSYLVFSHSLQNLEEVRSSLHGSPVVNDDGLAFSITPESLGAELQFQLFIAARIRLLPCLSYLVRPGVA